MLFFSEIVNAGALTAIAQLIDFTAPRGGRMFGGFLKFNQTSTGATVNFNIVRSGVVYNLVDFVAATNGEISGQIAFETGDQLRLSVAVTQAAGTVDAGLFGEYVAY